MKSVNGVIQLQKTKNVTPKYVKRSFISHSLSHLLTPVSTGEISVKGMCLIVSTALQERCGPTEGWEFFLISFIPYCHSYFPSAMVAAKHISPSMKHTHNRKSPWTLHMEDVKNILEKSNQRQRNTNFQIGKRLPLEETEALDKEWRAKITVWVRLDISDNFWRRSS